MNLEDVKQFVNQFETCVITTVSVDGQPEAVTVGLSLDDTFKVMVATNQSTRKARNLDTNQKIALVVGFEGPKTLQLEGVAAKVDPVVNQARINLHFEKVPSAKKFAGEAGQNYYLITPTWLRFTDYTQPTPIFETEKFV